MSLLDVGLVVNDSDPSGLRACQFPFSIFCHAGSENVLFKECNFNRFLLLANLCYHRPVFFQGYFRFFVLFKRGINSLTLNSVIIFAYFML